MTKIKKIFCVIPALLFVALILLGANMTTANANYDATREMSPERPTCNYIQYNTAVKYTWTAGSYGDQLSLYHRLNYELLKTDTYTEIAVPVLGSKHCDPYYYKGRTYSSTTGEYSSAYSIEWIEHFEQHENVRYGYDCLVTPTSKLPQLGGSYADIPTAYDKEYFVEKHNAKVGQKLKGTFVYNRKYVANIEVTVPWIGWQESSVTLDGVKFGFRTGPNKCSIKVDCGGVNAGNIVFYYGID